MAPPSSRAARVALVTGASRRAGIGAAIARQLAADGAAVFLHGWSPHDADQPWGADDGGMESLAHELRALGGRVAHASCDLAAEDGGEHLVEQCRAALGRVDAVVANHARSSSQSLERLTAKELDHSFAVNTRASLLLAKAYAAQHDDRLPGRLVLFTSGQHHGAMPDELPYVASKGALHQLTASLAVHLMPRGITVNCIDPGPTDTGWADTETMECVAARHPGGRWTAPEDVARVVAWLLGDGAAWITGQVINADGGWSSMGS